MNGQSTNALVDPLDADVAIKSRIFTIRGVQVMLDRDLAELYGVEAKALNRQVKRNIERFPEDFMFQLSRSECSRCQIGTLNMGRGSNVKYLPYAFTENGIAMLSGMLRSQTAIEVNIKIMRVFNAMRHALASMAPIFARIEETERRQLEYGSRQIADQRRDKELYHFGASLKDLGRHYCAVSRMDAAFIPSIMQRM